MFLAAQYYRPPFPARTYWAGESRVLCWPAEVPSHATTRAD